MLEFGICQSGPGLSELGVVTEWRVAEEPLDGLDVNGEGGVEEWRCLDTCVSDHQIPAGIGPVLSVPVISLIAHSP